MRILLLITYIIIFFPLYSFSHEYKHGNLMIDHPQIIKNSEHAKGYMIIVNKGKNEVYLTGGKAFFSKELFLHKEDQNNKSEMMKIDRIKIPAGTKVSMKDLNIHLMFLNYNKNLEWFEPHKAKLYFSDDSEIDVEFDFDGH